MSVSVAEQITAASPGLTTISPLIAGRYRLIEPLGRGGMGRVYRAEDTLLGRAVAVKLIFSDAVRAHDIRRACAREARAAARLNHPGIARIFDGGFDEDTCFVVMELVEGQTLAQILANAGPPPLDWVLSLAIQVADALDAAHRQGVIHCDVKPSNLILGSDGQVRLVDFGVARGSALTTSLGDLDLQGSAEYVAPEQVQGDPLDGRVDQYALGVVMYQMLAGRTPFGGGPLASVVARRIFADPPRLRDSFPTLPATIDQIVHRALAREPDRRFATAGQLRDALLTARDELGGTLTRPKRSWRPSPPIPSLVHVSRARELTLVSGRRAIAIAGTSIRRLVQLLRRAQIATASAGSAAKARLTSVRHNLARVRPLTARTTRATAAIARQRLQAARPVVVRAARSGHATSDRVLVHSRAALAATGTVLAEALRRSARVLDARFEATRPAAADAMRRARKAVQAARTALQAPHPRSTSAPAQPIQSAQLTLAATRATTAPNRSLPRVVHPTDQAEVSPVTLAVQRRLRLARCRTSRSQPLARQIANAGRRMVGATVAHSRDRCHTLRAATAQRLKATRQAMHARLSSAAGMFGLMAVLIYVSTLTALQAARRRVDRASRKLRGSRRSTPTSTRAGIGTLFAHTARTVHPPAPRLGPSSAAGIDRSAHHAASDAVSCNLPHVDAAAS